MRACARLVARLIVCATFLSAGIPLGWAQSFPNRPIKLVVPYVPGGGADTVARVMAQGLTEEFGQTVLVENKGGANTIIGTEFVANSPADGYTLLICTTAHAINPSLYKLNFDTLKAFTHVTMHLGASLLLVVNPAVAANSVSELIALAKAQPGKLTFASYGTGSPGHLAGELFMKLTGTEMLHIPYKGSSPSIADVVAGRATMSFAVLEPVLPFVKSGHVKALGVVMASANYPDTPRTGDVITGLPAGTDDMQVFHAGTAMNDGQVVTSGGRVLCVTALGETVKYAQTQAYQALDQIEFDGAQFRKDIGYRAVKG